MLNECYVLVSILPQDTVNLISCFIGNPFTESRNVVLSRQLDVEKNLGRHRPLVLRHKNCQCQIHEEEQR